MPRFTAPPGARPILGALPLGLASSVPLLRSPQEAAAMRLQSLGTRVQIWVARAGGELPARAAETALAGLTVQREAVDAAGLLAGSPGAAAFPDLAELAALGEPQLRLLVVRDGQQRPLACGVLRLLEEHAELSHLRVLPAWQRRGIGTLLMAALEAQAQRAGQALLRLRVDVRQRPAQRLCERRGFRRCGPFTADERAGPFALFMEKLLGD